MIKALIEKLKDFRHPYEVWANAAYSYNRFWSHLTTLPIYREDENT
jgi:hypothetical protein